MQTPTPQDIKDAHLQREGEALLAAIKPQAPKSLLVDPSGRSLANPDEKPTVELSPEAMRQQAEYQLEQRRLASAQKLEPIMARSEKSSNARDIAYLAYQLLFWSRMELSTNEDISDEMIEDLEHMLQWSIYKNAKDFNFAKMVSRLKNSAVPVLKNFEHEYSALGRVRGMRFKAISKVLGKTGIPTTASIEAVLGKPFAPGQMLILRGAPLATRAAVNILNKHAPEKIDRYRCSAFAEKGENVLPLGWWSNAAKTMEKLEEVLSPVTKAGAMLLFVEDVEALLTGSEEVEPKMSADERKAFAVKRIYQWCVEQTVAVIICDNTTEPVRAKRPYGYIPFIPVTLTGTQLTIGMESFKIEE